MIVSAASIYFKYPPEGFPGGYVELWLVDNPRSKNLVVLSQVSLRRAKIPRTRLKNADPPMVIADGDKAVRWSTELYRLRRKAMEMDCAGIRYSHNAVEAAAQGMIQNGAKEFMVLFQEALRREPFWMLVACVLKSEDILSAVRSQWRDHHDLAKAKLADVEAAGVEEKQARALVALACNWGEAPALSARDVERMPGCGKYARQSWQVFVDGTLPEDEITDKHLKAYVDSRSLRQRADYFACNIVDGELVKLAMFYTKEEAAANGSFVFKRDEKIPPKVLKALKADGDPWTLILLSAARPARPTTTEEKEQKEEPKKAMRPTEAFKFQPEPEDAVPLAEQEETEDMATSKKKARKTDRKRSSLDHRVTLLSKDNPHREGSKDYKQFEMLCKSSTVGKFVEKGGNRGYLAFCVRQKRARLSQPA